MRLLLIMFLCPSFSCSNAQVTVSGIAGWNSNSIKMVNWGDISANDHGGNDGWQLGGHVEYKLSKWFIYSGAELNKNDFFIHYYSLDGNTVATYHPLYLSIPAGFGYQFNLNRNVALRFYGGAYASVGVGGKLRSAKMVCGDFGPCLDSRPRTITNANIKYGNGTNNDVAPGNNGLQIGFGIKTWKLVEISCMYNAGLSNIYPHDFKSPRLTLTTVALTAKIDIVTFKRK